MKKLFLLILIFFVGALNVFAQDIVLPSQTGVVTDIQYVDEKTAINEEQVKQIATVKVLTGDFKGTQRIIDNILTGNPAYDIPLSKGDKVILHFDPVSQEVNTPDDVDIFIADIQRNNQVWLYVAIFSALLIIIGKKKGIRSIVSIAATVGLIFFVLLPLVLNGISPIIAALTVGVLSTAITIYLVAGINAKSTSAIAGTSVSLIFVACLSTTAIYFAHLTGFAGEENMFLYSVRPDLDFTGILSASMIIAALGALMDTAVSIASTINEIHLTDSSLGVRELFKSGMNVGRDIIGTMSNTLILVYLGSSLPLVLLSNNIDLVKFFNLNQVVTEVLSALIGSIAILACVPITAVIAANLIKREHLNIDVEQVLKKDEN